jgi:PAS domain S-box-containing protein
MPAGDSHPPADSVHHGSSGPGDAPDQPDLFRLLVQSIRDYAIFVLDPAGNVLTWNPGAQAMKGYVSEEIIGRHFFVFYPAEARQSRWPEHELGLAQREGRFIDEGWRVRKNGSTFWASVVITALRSADGKLFGFAKVTKDMTERRRAEEHIKNLNRELRERVTELDESRRIIELRTIELQKLSSQLLQIEDKERRRLARELHDDLGQQLSAVAMSLPSVKGTESCLKMVETAIASVRNISYLLHPPLLDETGLRATLHWFVEGFIKRSSINVTLSTTPADFPRLAPEIEAAIFRVVQESLTNVYRHAGSKKACVHLESQSGWVLVSIRDYGKGISKDIAARPLGVGIGSMRERVRQFQGDLKVSRVEPGTLVEVRIPLLGFDS